MYPDWNCIKNNTYRFILELVVREPDQNTIPTFNLHAKHLLWSSTIMITKRTARKLDTITMLLLLVVIGVSGAIIYQLRMYNNDGQLIMRDSENIIILPWKIAPTGKVVSAVGSNIP